VTAIAASSIGQGVRWASTQWAESGNPAIWTRHMSQVSFSIEVEPRAFCVKCGIERDFPESDDTCGMMAHSGETITVGVNQACGCGATRVRIEVELWEGDDDG
jgi:hypothetical protein